MRREGYEFAVGKPRVDHQGRSTASRHEPIERLVVDVPNEHAGKVIETSARAAAR